MVIFGCGAVKVNKKDLLVVANYLELKDKYAKSLQNLTIAWQRHNSRVNFETIEKIGFKKLKQIAG